MVAASADPRCCICLHLMEANPKLYLSGNRNRRGSGAGGFVRRIQFYFNISAAAQSAEKCLCGERYHRSDLHLSASDFLSLSDAALMSRLIQPLATAQQHLGHRSGVRSFVVSLQLLEHRFLDCFGCYHSKAGQRLSS